MNKADIKDFFEVYKSFFIFLVKPKELIHFVKKNKGWKFILKVLTYFITNTGIFVLLFLYLNTKQFTTKWIPLTIIIQCLIYIPLCLAPISFRNIKNIKDLVIIIKILLFEILVVYSTLLYFGIVLYFLFLITEIYVFYYIYLIYAFTITIYICYILSLLISDYKKNILMILSFLCCLGIHFSSTLLISRMCLGTENVILDIIFQESIKKAPKIIECEEYILNHQKIIIDLENSFFRDKNKDTLFLLNNQIDLILRKKEDIGNLNEQIIFNRNKLELAILIKIINAYEKIKREINTYECIPSSFEEDFKNGAIEIEKLLKRYDQIEQETQKITEKDKGEKYKDEILQIETRMKKLKQFYDDSLQMQMQMKINSCSIEEIKKYQDYIYIEIGELIKQLERTQKYWERRSLVLF